MYTGLTSTANADWNLWVSDPATVCADPDEAAAVGDPHFTTNSGKTFDLEGPALVEMMEEQTGAGCDNCADGYACAATSIGVGPSTVVRDAGAAVPMSYGLAQWKALKM